MLVVAKGYRKRDLSTGFETTRYDRTQCNAMPLHAMHCNALQCIVMWKSKTNIKANIQSSHLARQSLWIGQKTFTLPTPGHRGDHT